MKLFSNKKGFQQTADAPKLTRTQSLGCIPVKTEGVTWAAGENGDALIEYPIALKPFFINILGRFTGTPRTRLTKKLQLDETGSRVWYLMNGQHDVKTIIKQVAQETGLSLQEAELAVTAFLKELGKRGLIMLRHP
ncbi:PqqD family protein [Desulforhopalus singaporensis]|uniref:Coenzyme PQQ synthesis protein D (PqqD) n=1 Tax=Desulforhopalus singaporensis TaxID=91360 RepID=A0A1H0M633_9BACT|nr:PqqD family protein [Desulforhopalus singaporensis]SDO75928.1 Coenzyme PQQ synthesis protein D (PqqD) [Desulforhopalus singaporensis]